MIVELRLLCGKTPWSNMVSSDICLIWRDILITNIVLNNDSISAIT